MTPLLFSSFLLVVDLFVRGFSLTCGPTAMGCLITNSNARKLPIMKTKQKPKTTNKQAQQKTISKACRPNKCFVLCKLIFPVFLFGEKKIQIPCIFVLFFLIFFNTKIETGKYYHSFNRHCTLQLRKFGDIIDVQ